MQLGWENKYLRKREGGRNACHVDSNALYLHIMRQLTIVQYLKEVQPINQKTNKVFTRQGVLWRIKHNIALDYVSRIDQIGELWVLTIV